MRYLFWCAFELGAQRSQFRLRHGTGDCAGLYVVCEWVGCDLVKGFQDDTLKERRWRMENVFEQ